MSSKPDQNGISCIEFTYGQLKEATHGFSENCKLGEGGFGPVFKGTLLYTTVAIKKLRTVNVYTTCTSVLIIVYIGKR